MNGYGLVPGLGHSLRDRSVKVMDGADGEIIVHSFTGDDWRDIKAAWCQRGLLPDEILSRRKQGFEVPVGEFLRGPLASMFLDTVTPASLDRLELIDYPAVQRLYSDHCAKRGEHTELLFALLVLCHWEGRRQGTLGAGADNLVAP